MIDGPALALARAAAWLGGRWAFASPRRTARLLHGFACTEAQSELELRRAAVACDDVGRRALYLRHAVDEARHARTFAEQASRLALASGDPDFATPGAPSEDLFDQLGEIQFLAFVHDGEQRGRTQFEIYARLLRRRGSAALSQVFEQLVRDERHHEAYSARLLEELAGPRDARRALGRASRAEVWQAFRRRGRRLAGWAYTVCLLLVYLLLTPYGLLFRLLSRPRRGFSSEP